MANTEKFDICFFSAMMIMFESPEFQNEVRSKRAYFNKII